MSNLLFLCGTGTTGCHGYVESNREEAREAGWLVRRVADPLLCDPARIAVLLWDGTEVLLDDEGGYFPIVPKAG